MSSHVKCLGDSSRFEIVADHIYRHYGSSVRYIADVAGGQGLLARILNKKYNYLAEVIDPRGYALKGVSARQCEYTAEMADYYDLIVGLHPDEATRSVVESSLKRPVLIIPCCNFWDKTQKLGAKELIAAICGYLKDNGVPHQLITFNIKKPKNIGIQTERR